MLASCRVVSRCLWARSSGFGRGGDVTFVAGAAGAALDAGGAAGAACVGAAGGAVVGVDEVGVVAAGGGAAALGAASGAGAAVGAGAGAGSGACASVASAVPGAARNKAAVTPSRSTRTRNRSRLFAGGNASTLNVDGAAKGVKREV
jgi:hypothetical protein